MNITKTTISYKKARESKYWITLLQTSNYLEESNVKPSLLDYYHQ